MLDEKSGLAVANVTSTTPDLMISNLTSGRDYNKQNAKLFLIIIPAFSFVLISWIKFASYNWEEDCQWTVDCLLLSMIKTYIEILSLNLKLSSLD